MKLQARQFLVLAGLTAKETTRHPICLMLTLVCVLLCLLIPLLIAHELGEQGRLARDGALAFHFVIGLLIAGYAACSSLRREIQTGILSTVLSKSVSREIFFLSKFAGVAAVILLFSFCAALAAVLSQRMADINFQIDIQAVRILFAAPVIAIVGAAVDNYITRRPFSAHAMAYLAVALATALVLVGFTNRYGETAAFGAALEWRILPASLLITMALLLLAAIGLVLAVRWNAAPVIAVCAVVFLLGLMSDYLFGMAGRLPAALWGLRGILPDWQRFWVADALARGGTVSYGYVAGCAVYAFLCLVGILAVGIVSFRHSEME